MCQGGRTAVRKCRVDREAGEQIHDKVLLLSVFTGVCSAENHVKLFQALYSTISTSNGVLNLRLASLDLMEADHPSVQFVEYYQNGNTGRKRVSSP